MNVPAVALRDITCRFASNRPLKSGAPSYIAVEKTSLAISDGEFVSVIGPTGCGKSTLLNVTAGLLRPTEGVVEIFGEPLRRLNDKAGYMFQADSLLPWRTALANVTLGLEYRRVAAAEAKTRALELLDRVGLGGFGDRYPHQLSGGMRKRVSLAQMLILDPKILLMDEPFSALDVQTRVLMENELLVLWSGNRKSVLFITHDLEEAIALSDRVIALSAGPGTHPIGEWMIDLPRPRDIAEIRLTPRFVELHRTIWETMKEEVMKGYVQSQRK